MPTRPKRHQLERAEAIALMKLIAGAWWADFLHHSPNEEMNATARQLAAAQGTRSGFPDYALYVARDNYHGLAFELKAPKPYGRAPSPNQEWWLNWLARNGWRTVVCYGAEEALAALRAYTDGLSPRRA